MLMEKLAKYAHRDNGGAHLLLAIYHGLLNWIVQAIIAISGTVGIAIFAGNPNTLWLTRVCCVVYIALVIGSLRCQEYKKSQDESQEQLLKEQVKKLDEENRAALLQNNTLNAVLCDLCALDGSASNGIFRNARRIMYEGWASSISDMREAFGFQKMAMQVCLAVCRTLQQQFDLESPFVSVYQRFSSGPKSVKMTNSEINKMIAYGSKNGNEPITYSTLYPIPKRNEIKAGKRGKTEHTLPKIKYPLHSVIFALNEDKIYALPNHKAVTKKFVVHEGAEDREGHIEQYIGIPMKGCGDEVTFVLQVDVDKEGVFGESEDDVREFAKKYLYHYASLLRFYYEIDRLVEVANDYSNNDMASQRKVGT